MKRRLSRARLQSWRSPKQLPGAALVQSRLGGDQAVRRADDQNSGQASCGTRATRGSRPTSRSSGTRSRTRSRRWRPTPLRTSSRFALYKDEGISAKDTYRPDLQRLLTEEWTPTTVKRVLLQRINEGTLVYNRRQAKRRTHAPRPEEEHVVVEGYCEPIFSREEMAEVLRIAAEIEGSRPGGRGASTCSRGWSTATAARGCTRPRTTSPPRRGATRWSTTAADGQVTMGPVPFGGWPSMSSSGAIPSCWTGWTGQGCCIWRKCPTTPESG